MSCEAGAASSGGAITGPIKPPFAHPEWQGSVPAHWMDRGSGYLRGKPQHHPDVIDGFNGVARQGLGAFAHDAPSRVHEEGLRRTKQFPSADHRVAPWGDHPQEMRWKPSRRKLEDHEFHWRVGHGTKHAGLLMHTEQPDLLTKRPPFIDKSAFAAKPLKDHAYEESEKKVIQKVMTKKRREAMAEDLWERTQVLQLEAWERSHVQRQPAAATALSSTMPSLAASGKRRPQHSRSEPGLQFVRHQR